MARVVLMSVFFLWATLGIGQGQENPFDLKFRTPNPAAFSKKPVSESPADSSITSDILPNATLETNLNEEEDTLKTSASNPFELGIGDNVGDALAVVPDPPAKQEMMAVEGQHSRKPSKGIQIFFLLLSLLFLIFIVNVERSFIRDLWKVISNENYSSLHFRNQRNTMRQILLLMGYTVFILQSGIFLFHALDFFGYSGHLLDNIWTCIALVLAVYLVRHAVINYLRWLFDNRKEMTLFSFDISIFNIMVGLVLLPVNVLILFGPEDLFKTLIIIGLSVALIAYMMRQLRWMLTARQLIVNSLFVFFIYLCAVEILPLWALSKIFW